ncbi:terminase gpP N-terminus-related DNA-binding protein [Enterobacterales bacterium AW_CKDN230030176-1A_HGKHYDSX7]
MKTIYTLIAPPGAGKTSWLISRLSQLNEQNSVIAFPTKILASEVERRLRSASINFNSINSNTTEGSVIECLETALAHKNDRVIICTHESIRLISPDTLQGWHLYIDEVPSVWDCITCSFNNLSYHKVFDSIVDVHKVEGKSRLKAKGNCETLIEKLANGVDSTLSSEARSILTALLDNRYIVEIDDLDTKGNRATRIIGTKHYIPAFEAAESTIIMGAEIEKTLLGVILNGAGWPLMSISAKLDFIGYGNKVTIHPFFLNKSYSKSAALMKAGKVNQDYQEGCLLDAWLEVDVFRLIGKKKAILIAHSWCKPELPYPDNSEFSNVTLIPIDNRGINDYDDYSIAICLQHGNITPIESRSLPTLATMLSGANKVFPEQISSAIKYERFYESTLQSVCRTALRSKSNTGPILLFVQDMYIAEFLAEKIGNCTIDYTYPENYAPSTSTAKLNRNVLKQDCITLWEQGHSPKSIAEKIGKTERTIREWLKPYRELQQTK